jgi:hypothetical protein
MTKFAKKPKPAVTLPGSVEKVIPPPPWQPLQPEKAQIAVEGADHLYREIRIDNVLKNPEGERVRLKPGAHVDVTIETEPDATQPGGAGTRQ